MTSQQSTEADRLQNLEHQAYARRMDAVQKGRPREELQRLLKDQLSYSPKILALLSESQKKRLFQLQLQRRGLGFAASHLDFVRALGLTHSQLIKIAAINRRHRQIQSDLFRRLGLEQRAFVVEFSGRWPAAEFRRRRNAASLRSFQNMNTAQARDRDQEAEEHRRVLSPEQRAKWIKMLGPKYVEPPWP